jgi:DNA-binding MarR family transcriptional regulator
VRPDVIQEVTYLTLALSERLHENFARHAAGFGLTSAQARVLLGLEPGQALPMRVVADRLGFDRSNLTAFIDRLEGMGAVERRPDARDRRVKALVITEIGIRLRRDLWEALADDHGPLAHLTGPQAEFLRTGLVDALGGARDAARDAAEQSDEAAKIVDLRPVTEARSMVITDDGADQ